MVSFLFSLLTFSGERGCAKMCGGCVRNFSSFVARVGRFSNEMEAMNSCMDGEVECTLAFVMGLIPWERWRLEVRYLGIELKDFASKRTISIPLHPVLGLQCREHELRRRI